MKGGQVTVTGRVRKKLVGNTSVHGYKDDYLLASHPLAEIRAEVWRLGLAAYADKLRVPVENLRAHIERRAAAERGPGFHEGLDR